MSVTFTSFTSYPARTPVLIASRMPCSMGLIYSRGTDPPLISFCLDRNALTLNSFLNAKHFGVNVLSEHQETLSAAFARSSSTGDKFIGLAYDVGASGCPLLTDCLTHLECEREVAHEAGDHLIVVGRVIRLTQRSEGKPLLYFRGRYAKIVDATS